MLELHPSDISVCLTFQLTSALPRKGEIVVIGHVLLHQEPITFIDYIYRGVKREAYSKGTLINILSCLREAQI